MNIFPHAGQSSARTVVTYIRSRGDRSIQSLIDLEEGVVSREVYVNEEIYAEDEPSDYVYQVVRGAVRSYKLLNDGRRQIGVFHLPGDTFGLESGPSHRLTAEAIVDTTVRLVKCRG